MAPQVPLRGAEYSASQGSAVNATRPVRQRSITRPAGDRRTDVTDSVPVAPVAVTWPSTFTRNRSRPSRNVRLKRSRSENVPSAARARRA